MTDAARVPRRCSRALASTLLGLGIVAGVPGRLVAQDPTWSTCDPRPGRSCGGRALTRGESAEIEALYNAPATRRVQGAFALAADSVVGSALAVLGGPVRIAGRVDGSLLVLNGDVALEATAVITGDVAVLGGRLERAEGARTGSVRAEPDSVVYGRLAATRTYNRVEGWPIEFGPRLRWRTTWGTLAADAFGIIRTGDRLRLDGNHIGHDAKLELRFGRDERVTIGTRVYDVVAPVEDWQLSEVEVGLASFLFTSDYRDYFDRHGTALEASWQAASSLRLTGALRAEDWRPRRTLDPLSIFRADEAWRPNPQYEAGDWTITALGATYDTRSAPERPRTGWFVQGAYEYGRGRVESYLPDGPTATLPPVPARIGYGRAQLDLRRYTRISPASQLNARLFLAGWVHGDPLPLQRRLSLSGPGAMPAFDFRQAITTPDRLQCSSAAFTFSGTPALCDRAALLSLDYRHDIRWLVDLLDAPRFVRTDRSGAAGWVLFTDVGRGWLVNPRAPRAPVPGAPSGLAALHASVGLGLELYQGGIYVAKALGSPSPGPNVFLRLVRRF
ncbi:MAG: polymer-forming cytoskeletal protein [Gemmatimonadaceae bacterium]|nr:polymer-forming cytoskeletal protein [Gemmatimonadaceae bacterium]